jgi:hypothetical protein
MPIAAAYALLGINATVLPKPTRILHLMNVASIDDLLKDEIFEEILEDIREECSRFGHVISLKMPQPPAWSDQQLDRSRVTEPFWGMGRVFVEFDHVEDSKMALNNIAGRKYNGRYIIGGFWDEKRFYEDRWQRDDDEVKQKKKKIFWIIYFLKIFFFF